MRGPLDAPGLLRRRDDLRRTRPLLGAAAQPAGHQRPAAVRRAGHPHRRRDGASSAAARCSFGGRIGINGYAIGDLNLTATGEQMHLRYPEGFRSIVDAALTLRGDISSPRCSAAPWSSATASTRSGSSPTSTSSTLAGGGAARFRSRRPKPRRCRCGSTSRSRRRGRCASRTTSRAWSRAPTSRSTAPTTGRSLFGRAEIERGEILFEGNRYLVTRGTIDFLNPDADRAVLRHRGGNARARRQRQPPVRDERNLSRHHRASPARSAAG